jgi:hypothetical protein
MVKKQINVKIRANKSKEQYMYSIIYRNANRTISLTQNYYYTAAFFNKKDIFYIMSVMTSLKCDLIVTYWYTLHYVYKNYLYDLMILSQI